jgi:hypothetical protein
MASFAETAVIVGTGGRTPIAALKEVTRVVGTDDDLAVNSWLIHQFMVSTAQRGNAASIPSVEPDASWLEWRGTLARAAISLDLGRGIDSDALHALCRNISRYLRLTGNAVCLRRTNGISADPDNQVIWGVRAEWRDVQPGTSYSSNLNLDFTAWTSPNGQPAFTHRRPSTNEVEEAEEAEKAEVKPLNDDDDDNGSTASTMVACKYCDQVISAERVGRHVRARHNDLVDIPAILTKTIQRRGTAGISSRDLMPTVANLVGTTIFTSLWVNKMLRPLVDDGVLSITKYWGGDYRYRYTGVPETQPSQSMASAPAPAPLAPPGITPATALPAPASPVTPMSQPATSAVSTVDNPLERILRAHEAILTATEEISAAITPLMNENRELRARLRKLREAMSAAGDI